MTQPNQDEVITPDPADEEFNKFAKDGGFQVGSEPPEDDKDKDKKDNKSDDKDDKSDNKSDDKDDKSDNKSDDKDDKSDNKSDDKDDKSDDTDKKPAGRTPKMMPAWQHKKEVNQINQQSKKDITDLKSQIETLKNLSSGGEQKTGEAFEKEVEDLAEELSIPVKAVKKMITLANQNNKQPTELIKKLEDKIDYVDEQSKKLTDQFEDTTFNEEFESLMPLIKEEYPDISETDLADLKKRVHDIAFTKEYKDISLKVIYKGEDQFRPKKKPEKKRSSESSKGGQQRNDEVIDLEKVTDEDVDKWKNSDDPKDKEKLQEYFDYMDKKNK